MNYIYKIYDICAHLLLFVHYTINQPLYVHLNLLRFPLGNQEKALSVSCLEYEPTIPAKFMIGTDQGMALGLFHEFHLFVQHLKHWKSSYFHLPARILKLVK